ncbi:type VI secretion system protein [Luteimonas salinilitoris]|uniref:Type VI secretion system protein n=1 Tax=Luteimonas salinilitoris TaxID=3237697 RepID=A0ABV4HRZ4_9GAMM
MRLPNPLYPLQRLVSWAGSLFSQVRSLYRPVAEGAKKPWLRRIVVALLVLVLLVALVIAAIVIVPSLPARFWQLLGLCAVALAVLWWFIAGQRRFTLQGRTRKRIGDLGPGNPEDEREPLARMAQAIAEAKRTIARSPEMEKGRDPLYRVPWMLFLGDAEADVEGLLRAGAEVSPFSPPTGDGAEIWRWWFFKSLIAVQMHPRVVCDAAARLERGLWYQALMQLAAEREKLPLNGIVLTVSVQTLLGPADALKSTATRLRRLVDEAMEHLQVRMPVYIAVSGLERLRGYQTVRDTLPAEAFAQALGHRLPENEAVSSATSGRLDQILTPILDRLHALRMTALRAQATAATRHDAFEFVEALRGCASGLSLFVTLLLEDNTFQRTPPWRGLYFVGGADAAHPGGAFVADLFTRFLPADQPLAAPSLRGSAGRLAVAALGVAALLGFSGYLAYGLSAARQDDTQLLASTRSACRDVEGRLGSARIEWVASCGRTIEQLESAAEGTLLGFGIRRADRDIETLKQRVTEDFSNLILAPYDQMLAEDLDRGRAGFEHALAIAQRLRLLDACRGTSEPCLKDELPNNVAFDARSRLFAPFVTPDNDTRRDRDNAAALFGAYLGYLRWQKKKVLNGERERLQAQLRRLMEAQTLDTAQVRAWADARAAGLSLGDFWLPDDRVVGVDADSLPTVSRAFTYDTWNGAIAPFLDTARDEAGVQPERVESFRDAYFREYFDEWARLQARFGEGIALWKGHEAELVARAAGTDNPYAAYFRAAGQQLYALPLKRPLGLRWRETWAQMKSAWLSSWRPLGRFIGDSFRFGGTSITPPVWLTALRDTEIDVLAPQAPLFARGYLRLQADGGAQDVYRIVADLFASRGIADKPPASEYAELLAAVDKPAEAYAEQFGAEDLAAWSVAQGPARLLLRLTVRRAGEYVQQRWRETVVKPLAALPPERQASALLGPQGRLEAFVGDWLKPFITDAERAPVSVGGVAMPLSADYRALLSGGRAAPASDAPFPAGIFTLDAPSHLGTLLEGPQGTTFEVICAGESFSITSKGESLTDAQAQVRWSPTACSEARIRISLPPAAADRLAGQVDAEPEAAVAEDASAASQAPVAADDAPATEAGFRLTLLYRGADGFVRLFDEFGPGAHVFSISDFRDSYSPSQWEELHPRLQAAGFRQARVHLRIEPSEEMKRFLAARGAAPLAVPESILD